MVTKEKLLEEHAKLIELASQAKVQLERYIGAADAVGRIIQQYFVEAGNKPISKKEKKDGSSACQSVERPQ